MSKPPFLKLTLAFLLLFIIAGVSYTFWRTSADGNQVSQPRVGGPQPERAGPSPWTKAVGESQGVDARKGGERINNQRLVTPTPMLVAGEEYRRTQETIQRRIRDNHPPEPVGKDGLTTESAWALTLEKMEAQISPAMFHTWLKNTMLVSVEGKNANIVVPNQNTADWIDRRLYQSLNRTFRDIIGREVDFRFVPAAVSPLTAA